MHGRGRSIDFYDPAEDDRKESLRQDTKGGVKKAAKLDREGDVVMGDEEEEEVGREGGREGGGGSKGFPCVWSWTDEGNRISR